MKSERGRKEEMMKIFWVGKKCVWELWIIFIFFIKLLIVNVLYFYNEKIQMFILKTVE